MNTSFLPKLPSAEQFTQRLTPPVEPTVTPHHKSENDAYIEHAPELALSRTWKFLITPIALALFPIVTLASLIIAVVYCYFKNLTFQELVAHLLIVSPENLKNITIPTEHKVKIPLNAGIELDGIKVDKGHRKWLIYLNGFRGSCRKNYSQLMKMISQTNTNLLSADYEGVGFSNPNGMCRTSDVIVANGKAMVEYLTTHLGVKEEDIIIHGYSLGGGVGAQLAKLYQNIKFLSDRSFVYLYPAMVTFLSFPIYNVFIARIIRYYWGELNSFEALKSIDPSRIRIVVTPQDIMVDFNQASLYSGYKKAKLTPPLTFLLNFTHQRKELCGRCFHLASAHYGHLSPEHFKEITSSWF